MFPRLSAIVRFVRQYGMGRVIHVANETSSLPVTVPV